MERSLGIFAGKEMVAVWIESLVAVATFREGKGKWKAKLATEEDLVQGFLEACIREATRKRMERDAGHWIQEGRQERVEVWWKEVVVQGIEE